MRYVAGVCAGVAAHVGWPVWAVRLIFVLGVAFQGVTILAYLLLWGLVPTGDASGLQARRSREASGRQAPTLAEKEPIPDDKGAQSRRRSLVFGLVLIGAVGFITVLVGPDVLVARAGLSAGREADSLALCSILVCAGYALIWRMGLEGISREHAIRGVGLLAGFFLVYTGATLYIADVEGLVARIPIVSAGLLALTLLAVAPLLSGLGRARDTIDEVSAREEARAEVAAHLHDSVLQTLAIIRNRADDAETVRRLARTQERDLRRWLYEGVSEPETSLSRALADRFAELEDCHGVPIDLVTVADLVPDEATRPLIDVLTEAASNAVRHGQPPVSVYVEVGVDTIEAHVRDRGKGFDPDTISDRHFGVRESILARTRRCGGEVTVTVRPSGCDVGVTWPRRKDTQHE